MRIRRLVYVFQTLILLFMLAACGSTMPKETQVQAEVSTAVKNTIAESESITAEDVVTTEAVESTGQSEIAEQMRLSYQVVHRGTVSYKNNEKRFALFTCREDVDKLDALDPQTLEKYDDEWFKTHSFVLSLAGHGSCCSCEFNRIEMDGKVLNVYIDYIHNEQLYQKNGKDYTDPNYGGASHHEDYLATSFFIEFDRNGEEMMELIDKVVYRSREYPSSTWGEGELLPREPVLETESIPFVVKSMKAQKDAYRHDSDEVTYTEWENKVVTVSNVSTLSQCFVRNELIDDIGLFLKYFAIRQRPLVYVMIGMDPSYRCEIQKVSVDGTTLKLYADAVYEDWDKLTETEKMDVKTKKEGCAVGLDTYKYELFIGIETESKRVYADFYKRGYTDLMKTIEACVLTVKNVHTGETTELELNYYTTMLDHAY